MKGAGRMSLEVSEQIGFIEKMTAENIFHLPDISDFAEFEKYRRKITIGDLSFTSCYLWAESMHYRIRTTPHAMFVLGLGADHEIGIYALFGENVSLIEEDILFLRQLFADAHIPLRLECVSESDVTLLRKLPFSCEVSFDENYSDYIYDNADFSDIVGSRNKTRRHEYNRFVRLHPDAILVRGHFSDAAVRSDCTAVFDKWCARHSCAECRFGCEKKAFDRLEEIEMPNRHLLGIVYEKGQPLSFGFGELLTEDCVFFHVQKNAVAIDGLSYFLHRNMALQIHPDVKIINWGEDMGMEGIRRNKSRYRPIEWRKKYNVLIKE